ncbi:MAG TPA: hypothetical protein VH183_15295 [Burkholderiaceae bacterium]|nr:hypothetical protein [Burkholderiaceae bacterium]
MQVFSEVTYFLLDPGRKKKPVGEQQVVATVELAAFHIFYRVAPATAFQISYLNSRPQRVQFQIANRASLTVGAGSKS